MCQFKLIILSRILRLYWKTNIFFMEMNNKNDRIIRLSCLTLKTVLHAEWKPTGRKESIKVQKNR